MCERLNCEMNFEYCYELCWVVNRVLVIDNCAWVDYRQLLYDLTKRLAYHLSDVLL